MTQVTCPACLDPTAGVPHTCPGSGTWKAAEAHAEGAVDEIEQEWPRYFVDLRFRVRALDEDLARHKLTDLVHALLEDDQVEEALFTIRPVDEGQVAA